MRSEAKKVIRWWRGMRLRRMGIVLALGALAVVGAQAQGVRYDNIVLGPRGTPVGGAQIAVCTAAAVRTTTPCSPLAQIYSDQALTQPAANPFPADSLGNYGFWAEPGHYVVQIYGTGVTTRAMDVFLACDPNNCTMTSATFSTITAGTLNLTGALTVNGRAVATQPVPNDGVQYVSPSGSDANNGLSWGTAKQTIYAAWNALYAINGGAPNYVSGNGGTIYVAANSSCGGPVTGQGLWIMGSSDPNWNNGSVPSGWVKDMPVRIVGVGTSSWMQNAPGPAVPVNCGSGASANLPSLWISGVASPMEFENLDFLGADGGAYQAMRLGIDSSGVRDDNAGAVGLTFDNDQFYPSNNAAGGPTVDIGSNVFNIQFNNDMIQGDNAAPGGTDEHQAMVINGGGGSCHQPGLIFIRNMHLNNGDIKFYSNQCENGGSLYVNGLVTENQDDGKGAVWLTTESSSGFYDIRNVTVADANPGSPSIEVDNAVAGNVQNPDSLITNFEVPGVPGTMLGGGDSLYYGTMAQEPSAWSQTGFLFGKVWGQSDAARRLFGMVESRWQNKAPFDPTQWTPATGSEAKVTDPTGTSWAGSGMEPIFTDATQSFTAGDFLIAGGWYKIPSKTGLGGYPLSIAFLSGGCQMQPIDQSSTPSAGFPIGREGLAGDGQWTWASSAFVVTTGGTCELRFQSDLTSPSTSLPQYYAPVLYIVPGSTVSSYSEIADEAQNLAPYAYGLSNLADATLPGHPIAFGGSGDSYLATIDHTGLTSNQTYTLPASGGTLGVAIGETTVAGPTSAIAAGACAATVTKAVGGVTTAMTILATPNADPAVAGYKDLTVYWFPTSGNVNLEVCNPSASSVTPAALTFNVRAIE